MEVIINSFLLVLACEMGDKTQLLALVLATKFKKPWTVMAGILVATILNHGLASYAGEWLAILLPDHIQMYVLAITFFAFGFWVLIPDKDEGMNESPRYGAFLTTLVIFFLAEMGDKTQLATVALGAQYSAPVLVTLGTTLGMLAADGIVVFLGERILRLLPMKWIRVATSVLFFAFGVVVLFKPI